MNAEVAAGIAPTTYYLLMIVYYLLLKDSCPTKNSTAN